MVTPAERSRTAPAARLGCGPNPIGCSSGLMGWHHHHRCMDAFTGREIPKVTHRISFKTFYQGRPSDHPSQDLFPRTVVIWTSRTPNSTALRRHPIRFVAGFESADHPMDAWLERSLEICKDFGGVVKQRAEPRDNALETSRKGPQGSWRHQFRYLPRLMITRAG